MCRNKSCGIPRCPADTSISRQNRRIASKISKGVIARSNPLEVPLTSLEGVTIEKTLDLLAEVKEMRNDHPDYDLKITEVGHHMSALVDDLLLADGITPEVLQQKEFKDKNVQLYLSSRKEATLIAHYKGQLEGVITEEERVEVEKKIKHHSRLLAKISREARSLERARQQDVIALGKKVSKAHRDVLALTRDLGGRAINISESSNRGAVRILNKALWYLPTDWINASNNGDVMNVRATVQRAHYRPDYHITTVRVPEREDILRPVSWRPSEKEVREEGWRLEDNNFRGNIWSRIQFEDFDPTRGTLDAFGEPVGNRWKQYSDGDGKKKWRRTILREVEIASEGAELFISPDDNGQSVALHEFMHRVQDMNENVQKAERAHHARRIRLQDGSMQAAEALHGHGHHHEMVQPDHYANRYMGRVYDEGSHFTEILSNGVQALFYGEHGSFMGIGGRHIPDQQSRSFTLGALAVC